PRRTRHGRAVPRVGPQASRSEAGPVVRRARTRARSRRRGRAVTQPPDQAARDRIVADIGTNLFVEAGAGAGKTSKLVDRILELVRHGVAIEAIAAITFTEKAAADLRRRLRESLLDPDNEHDC